ncbi:MAG: hypothetical protein EBZ49_00360 [Proteobacteria bacterium]|nr:hypothetical protein [Pseudomonadota bacterium]
MKPEKKKNKKDESYYKSPMMRAFQAGTGLGMVRGNLIPATSPIKGYTNLWHGTPIANLYPGEHGKGIFQEGLTTEFAGKNKRLNYALMSNAVMRDTEEFLKKKKIKITPEIEKALFEETEKMMELGGTSFERILKSAPSVAKRLGLDEKELAEFYKTRAGDLGKRIYFGKSPESVAFWANEGKNEIHFLFEKMKQEAGQDLSSRRKAVVSGLKKGFKDFGEVLAEQFSGGMYSDIRAKTHYGKPAEAVKVKDLGELANAIKHHSKEDVNVIFRSSVPTKSLDYLKDFPVLRHGIASLPSVKMLLGKYIPQSDPSKDLSIAENLSPEFINQAHVVDRKTGKLLKSFHVQSAKKQPFQFLGGKGNRIAGLKKATIPIIMTAAGAKIFLNAFKGIGSKPPKEEKTAAVDPKTLAKVFAVPAAAVGGSFATAAAIQKLLGVREPALITEEEAKKMKMEQLLAQQADEIRYLKNTAPAAGLASGILGAGIGAALTKHRGIGAIAGGYLGSTLGMGAATVLLEARQNQIDPENSGLAGMLLSNSDKGKEFIRKNPKLFAGLSQTAATGLAAALPYYVAKKYYPWHAQKVKRLVSRASKPSEALVRFVDENATKILPLILLGGPASQYLSYLAAEQTTKGIGKGVGAVRSAAKSFGSDKKDAA